MSHVHAFSIHLYFFSHILLIVNCFGTFLIVFFLSTSSVGYVSNVYGT